MTDRRRIQLGRRREEKTDRERGYRREERIQKGYRTSGGG